MEIIDINDVKGKRIIVLYKTDEEFIAIWDTLRELKIGFDNNWDESQLKQKG